MLRGERRLKFEEAQRAARYLGVGPGDGFAEAPAPFETKSAQTGGDDGTAPLYRAHARDNGLWVIDRTEIIERRPRAPHFAGAELVFGFYAPDDAMAPRFYTGEVVWANPARPAAIGEDAILMARQDTEGALPLYLCCLTEATPERLSGRQYGSGATRTVPAGDWRAAHVYGRR